MKLTQIFGGLLCALGGWALTACSADEPTEQLLGEGKGAVRIALEADAGFEEVGTKALDESKYRDTDLYTVQILQGEAIVKEYTGATIPDELIELTNGSYTVKAFYGEDKAVSTSSMYVEGTEGFDVQSNQVANVEVSCAPVCAKVTLTFDADMGKYFSDWETLFKTVAMEEETYIHPKSNTDPIYLKVNKNEQVAVSFHLTDKNDESKITKIDKPYTMNPNEALNISIKPSPTSSTGNLGITITIDGSTNDETINIEIPSDWI